MNNKREIRGTLPVVVLATLATVAYLGGTGFAAMYPNPPSDFKELLTMTEKLESAAKPSPARLEAYLEQRQRLLYQFARAAKGQYCERQWSELEKSADELEKKAAQFIYEKNKTDWFAGMWSGNAMRALRGVGRNDPFLAKVTERYEAQSKFGNLNKTEVECDANKFLLRNLHKVLFVLQTDVKYLLTEDQQTLNQAIYEGLKSNGYRSRTNFYAIDKLNEQQSSLLRDFYADRVNVDGTTIETAVDHFHAPSEFIIGRLIDSCFTMANFQAKLGELNAKRQQVCPQDAQSSGSAKNALIGMEYKFDKYRDTFNLCDDFLQAL